MKTQQIDMCEVTPEKNARDPRFDLWMKEVAAHADVDQQLLYDIFDAMDDEDK